MKIFIKSLLAGMFIAIGGTVFLMSESKVIGSFLFSVGLLGILSYGFNLYTGKVGYLVQNRSFAYIKELLITIAGNFIGTFIVAFLIRSTRLNVLEKVTSMVDIKLNDSLLSIFILAIFCGMLMFIGVDLYKKSTSDFGRHLMVVLAVMVFIISGFEHCVANMFYFALVGYKPITFTYLIVMIMGNGVGGCLISAGTKLKTD